MKLPDGFDDATKEMQRATLAGQDANTLVNAIRAELGKGALAQREKLSEWEMAGVLLELWDDGEHRLAGAEPRQQPTEDDA